MYRGAYAEKMAANWMKCLTLRRAAIPPMRSGLRAMLFDPASSCLNQSFV
jgi:hypothetical protein